jgi:outer membrane protein insertion porin family
MRAFTTEVTRVVIAAILMTLTPVVGVDLGIVSASQARADEVSSIVVHGNERMDPETVRSYITIKPGKSFTSKDVDDSLKALYATELFGDVKIERQGGSLVVTVTESALVNKVQFEGNRRLTDEQLGSVIETKARSFLSKSRVQSDVQRLLEVYRRSGRFRASIEPKIINLPQGRVNLVYEIDEGDKTSVSRISFVGNHSFSEGRLRDLIKTRETGFLGFIRTTDTYDSDRLDQDQETLRKFYLRNGFADVRIVAANADLDRERNLFLVTFTIDEGSQYTFGDVDLQSSLPPSVDPNALKSAVRTHAGDLYNAEDIDKSIEDITAVAARSGFSFSEVRPRAIRDYASKKISLVYYVEEGTHVYVNRINIRGNTRTRDYVIRREFDVLEGDPYNKALISKAERRLNRLGFFKTVKVTPEQIAPDKVDINVDVEEQSTGELSFGAGYSTTDGILGDVSIGERNLLGRGQFIKLGFQLGQYQSGVNFSFTEPYFLDRRVSAGIDLYQQTLKQTYYRPYREDTYGGTIRFGLPITEDLTVAPSWSLASRKISLSGSNIDGDYTNGEASLAYKTYVNNDPYSLLSATTYDTCGPSGGTGSGPLDLLHINCSRTQFISTPALGLIYNTIDNIQFPRSGVYVKWLNEFAGAGGDVSYLRTTLDARYYHELYADWGLIGALKLKAGQMYDVGNKPISIIDDFFIGGETIRGFAPSGIGARDVSQINSGGVNYTSNEAFGGKTYIVGTAEVNAPFPGTPEEFGLYYSVFADAGTEFGIDKASLPTAYQTGVGGVKYVDSAKMRASIGVGVVWKSPFGPIRMDFGFPLLKAPGDQTEIFRFSGGTQF